VTPADHSGFDQRVLLTVRDGKWALLQN